MAPKKTPAAVARRSAVRKAAKVAAAPHKLLNDLNDGTILVADVDDPIALNDFVHASDYPLAGNLRSQLHRASEDAKVNG